MSGARCLLVTASASCFLFLPALAAFGDTATGGETIATATVIAAFPFFDTGNTCGHTQDFIASCGDNHAPDLFYQYTAPANLMVTFSACGSGYDTVLYALEDGIEIACNDDFCGLQSELTLRMQAGRTYTIGVSGYSTACGAYVVTVAACGSCGGACCLTAGCTVLLPGQCASAGGIYLGDGTTCEPDPCAATPVAAATWGAIKSAYRDASE